MVAALACNRCQEPVAAEIGSVGGGDSGTTSTLFSNAQSSNSDIAAFELRHQLVPTPGPRETLPGLPEDLARAFTQAETMFDLQNMEEPTAIAYRRVIERAISVKHSELAGDLIHKISALALTHVIPQQMADRAHQVRIIGNNGAHGDRVERADIVAAREFADAFLRYLIVLPDQVAARRRATGTDAPTEDPGPDGEATIVE
jgi:hypothetical protein